VHRPAPSFPLAALCLLGLAFVQAGCGYRLAAGDLRSLGSVAIETPVNDAGEPGLEFVVADALRRELMRRSGPQLIESPEQAAVVVSGRLTNVKTSPAALSSVVLVLEYETTMDLELRARRGGEVMVETTQLQESERYLASADVEALRKNRQEALRRIASVLAARFLDRLADKEAM
jgi:hypothetical protein